MLSGAVRVADGMRGAGIGHAADIVDVGIAAFLHVVFGHDGAVLVAHDLDIDALIAGSRIAVIAPEEGADPHFPERGGEDFEAVG